MKKLINLITSLAFLLTMLLPARLAMAASATLSLSPSSGSVTNGNTVTLDIHVNSGSEPVNFIDAELTYASDKFDYVSTNSSSAYDVSAPSSGGSGSISVNRGTSHTGGLSGDQIVASIVLRAKTDSGSGAVNFSNTSKVYSANTNNNIYTSGSGANYTLTAAPSGGSGGGSSGGGTSSGTSSGGSSSSTATKPTTTPTSRPAISTSTAPITNADNTAPTISNINVSDISATSAVIKWTTSEPSKSEVDYGIDQKYGNTKLDTGLVTDHELKLDSALITASTLYHFVVKSTDAAGNVATSSDQTFTTANAGPTPTSTRSLSIVKVTGFLLLLAAIIGGFIAWRRRNSPGAQPPLPPTMPNQMIQQPPTMPQTPMQYPPTNYTPTPPAA